MEGGAFRAGGNSASASFPSPNIKHSIWKKKKREREKESFWLFGLCWPPLSQASGQAGEGYTRRWWTLHPRSFRHRGSSNS